MSVVAVVGASKKPERYSHKAMTSLLSHNHKAIPVSVSARTVLGQKGYASLTEIPGNLDDVTLYLNPKQQEPVIRDILRVKPKRVIFNPGAENPGVYAELEAAGIRVEQACTLVLLSTGQF
jgi:predicted CoA-binding protein